LRRDSPQPGWRSQFEAAGRPATQGNEPEDGGNEDELADLHPDVEEQQCQRNRLGGPPQEIPLTQAELAAISNVSRNTLGTILRGLQDAGLISIGYGKIRPQQPEKLRARRSGMRLERVMGIEPTAAAQPHLTGQSLTDGDDLACD